MSKKFRPHPVGLQGGAPARHTAQGIGKVEVLSGTTLPQIRTPSELDIYVAINDVSQKVAQLSKNQQVLEAKLDYLTTRLDAANANLIMGIQYLGRMVTGTEWLVIGDPDTAETWLPKHAPQWQ
jgi:hypothetical protein